MSKVKQNSHWYKIGYDEILEITGREIIFPRLTPWSSKHGTCRTVKIEGYDLQMLTSSHGFGATYWIREK